MNEDFIFEKHHAEREANTEKINNLRIFRDAILGGKYLNYMSQDERMEILKIYQKEIESRLTREIPTSFTGIYRDAGKWKYCHITVLEAFVHSYTGQEKYCSRMEYPDGYVDYRVLNKEEIVDYLVFAERLMGDELK